MYTPMGPLLREAKRERYGVLAVNALNLETMATIIRTAERMRAPIIVDLYQAHLDHMPLELMVPSGKWLAEQATVPVAINLDHGSNPALVKRSIVQGLSSVMIDASTSEYEENIRTVTEIVEFSVPYGVSVEAELGGMGAAAGGAFTNAGMFTDPAQAAEFVQRTGIDALAVSYGSSHGLLPDGYFPEFDFDRLAAIRDRADVPLVLHGTSGSGEDNVRRSVELGVAKVNMGADFMHANVNGFVAAVAEDDRVELSDALANAMEKASETVTTYIQWTNSAGRI